MESIKNFFAWWFGELRMVFSGQSRSPLALVFSQREVALTELGTDAPLGIVEFDAPNRAERIEALRSIAERRTGPTSPVEIMLPREQFTFLELGTEPTEKGNQSLAVRAAEKTGRKSHELLVATGPTLRKGASGAPATLVATALIKSVQEARSLAQSWGFQPIRVTSVEWPKEFLNGPDFYSHQGRFRSPLKSRLMLGLAALAVMTAGLAASRTMAARAHLADESAREFAQTAIPRSDLINGELQLATYAHAASSGIEGRSETVPIWYLLSELAALMPGDIELDHVSYDPPYLNLKGTGSRIDLMARSLDRSLLFTAPRVTDTRARSRGRATFEMDVVVNARGPR